MVDYQHINTSPTLKCSYFTRHTCLLSLRKRLNTIRSLCTEWQAMYHNVHKSYSEGSFLSHVTRQIAPWKITLSTAKHIHNRFKLSTYVHNRLVVALGYQDTYISPI